MMTEKKKIIIRKQTLTMCECVQLLTWFVLIETIYELLILLTQFRYYNT